MSRFAVIEATGLPENPLDAAALFHTTFVSRARAAMGDGDVVLAFNLADHTHHGWRLAVVQELAREAAPRRVNAVVGAAGPGREATLAYLARAPGVTGQVLQASGNSAETA